MVAGMVTDIDTKGVPDINTLLASCEVSTCVGVLNQSTRELISPKEVVDRFSID